MRTELVKADAAAVERAAALIRAGQLVAFPTETVYGLGADALDAKAVNGIFAAKGRPSDNPLIVHVADIGQAGEVAVTDDPRFAALAEAFWPGPLTLVVPKRPSVPDAVTAGLDTVGVRMPDHPVALALIRVAGPIAAPSANRSGLPSPSRAEHVQRDMEGRIPMILDGGACRVGLESTVVSLTGEKAVVLRPGGVTPEMLMRVLGTDNVTVHQSALAPLEGVAASPGMKYKHYAPKAQVFLAKTDEAIRAACRRDEQEGRSFTVLITRGGPLTEEVPCMVLGTAGREDKVAAELFDALRACDDRGAQRVYVQSVPAEGIGLAVMNRLLRAAGFRVLEEEM